MEIRKDRQIELEGVLAARLDLRPSVPFHVFGTFVPSIPCLSMHEKPPLRAAEDKIILHGPQPDLLPAISSRCPSALHFLLLNL
jgi:hypothetical protein